MRRPGLRGRGRVARPLTSRRIFVWFHPWLPDIISYLVSSKNLEVAITKSDLELATLDFHKTNLLAEVPTTRMAAPRSGSDNTHPVSWSTHKALEINPVVTDLLYIRVLHSR